jgi:GntR family transcriptional regulator/MocR family aminotransferase
MPLSHDRRAALVAWARRRGALIVEDDYDSEFRFGGRPLETLSALDPGGRVIYVGSFSKTLLPALRLGYVVCPPGLRQPLRAASSVACGFPQGPGQAALAAMLEGGLLARHVRRMRRAYAARHALILGTLERDFTRWLQPVPSVTGLHLTARLRSGGVAFEQRLADRARTRGVRFDRLSGYCASGVPQPGIVLGYGGVAEAQIPEALRRLRQCFAAVLRK